MDNAKRILLACLVGSLLSGAAYAGGFQLNETGAAALAQGGAFAARANDGSAFYFNPAGLAFQTQPSLYLGATLISPTTSFFGPTQLNSNAEWDNVKRVFTPINFCFSYHFDNGLTAAVGVDNPFGLGSKWDENWVGKFLSTNVDLRSFFISPTLAYQVTDKFSLGAGVNYVVGSVLLDRAVPLVLGTTTPRVNIDMTTHGWGFNVGALYKFTPELSVGASYRSQVKLDPSGTATFIPDYNGLLPSGNVTTSITLPATAFVGLAYKPVNNLELEADYQFTGWSSYNTLTFTFSDGSTSSSPKNYQDTYLLRFGGQYTVCDFRLRAGYYYDHSPVKTEYVEPMLPDASRNGFSVGVGYNLTSRLVVDAAFLFIKFDNRQAQNTIPQIAFDGTYETYVGLYGLNFGYTF